MIFDSLPDDGLVFVRLVPDQPPLPGLGSDGVLLDESDLLELLEAVRGQWWVQEDAP